MGKQNCLFMRQESLWEEQIGGFGNEEYDFEKARFQVPNRHPEGLRSRQRIEWAGLQIRS